MTNSNNRLELPVAFLKEFVASSEVNSSAADEIRANLFQFKGVEKRVYKRTARRLTKLSKAYEKAIKSQVRTLKKVTPMRELRSIVNPGNDAFFNEEVVEHESIFDRLAEKLPNNELQVDDSLNEVYPETQENNFSFEESQIESFLENEKEFASIAVNTSGPLIDDSSDSYDLDFPDWVNER